MAKGTWSPEEREAWIRAQQEKVAQWKTVREFIQKHRGEAEAEVAGIVALKGIQFSLTNFMLVRQQLTMLGWAGTPYIDVQTFDKWKEMGRGVKEGEKSQIFAVTWVTKRGARVADAQADGAKDGDMEREQCFPKVVALFHYDQTCELDPKWLIKTARGRTRHSVAA